MKYKPEEEEESVHLRKEPCPSCGSRDNLGRYSDGHGFCFGCGYYEPGDGEGTARRSPKLRGATKKMAKELEEALEGFECRALPSRSLDQETAKRWDYRSKKVDGKVVHAAVFKDEVGNIVAAKFRDSKKKFWIEGDKKALGLYGKWLWPAGGRMICVTEGEIDALSVSQCQDHKWPVVSVPNGAQGAAKAIKKDYEYLSSFEKVVLWFDNDEAGQRAALECAEILPAGKTYIVKADLKDANEYLDAGRSREVTGFLFKAERYRPDGIVSGDDLWEKVSQEDDVYAVEYPWQGLQKITHGLRAGELITVTAGTGVGKSTFIREIGYHLIKKNENVGFLCLEESTRRTALGLMGLELNEPLHISRDDVSDVELRQAFELTVGREGVYLYDHFGSLDVDSLLEKIRYLAKACDCRYIILDHLSIVVSGIDMADDERRAIDRAMTLLRTLVEETGIGLIVISHLRRTSSSSSHEEGGQVSLRDLRGSQAIAQLSDMVIALERDQQSDDESNIVVVRVLKNRFSGDTGFAGYLIYDKTTGRLTEAPEDFVPGETNDDPDNEY